MAHITRKRAGDLKLGDQFVEVDDDTLVTDEEIAANYDVWDQIWYTVRNIGGSADIGWIECTEPFSDESFRIQGEWDQFVWVYID